MDKNLAIRTINRCNEVGVFDMRCLKREYESTGDMLRQAVDILIDKNTDDIPSWVRKYVLMDDEQFEREKLYQATMNMFRAMVEKGIITKAQYNVIDAKMLQKYRPLLGGLFSENTCYLSSVE